MKRFKEMIEDAPVNATGDAVATNEPIVRKKKKEDSSGREIGTPDLLKRYKEDTPGEMSENVDKKTILKQLSKVKGLSKKGAEMIVQLPQPTLMALINQLSLLAGDEPEHEPHVKDKEKEKKKVVLRGSFKSVQEARLLTDGKLVTSIEQVFEIITKKLKSEMGKRYKRNKEQGITFVNSLARIVGMTASDKGQTKNKMFLKMGMEEETQLEEGRLSDLLIDIQQGATAKELARDWPITLQQAKDFLKDYYASKPKPKRV